MSSHEFDFKTGRQFWIALALLAGVAGALLALGCDKRAEPGAVSAAAASEDFARDESPAPKPAAAIENEVANLEQQLAEARQGVEREIEQARTGSEQLPVAARERLAEAIERTEEARDEASDRLDELKYSGPSQWEMRRARVVEALSDLSEARHDVVAALAGGEPSLSEG